MDRPLRARKQAPAATEIAIAKKATKPTAAPTAKKPATTKSNVKVARAIRTRSATTASIPVEEESVKVTINTRKSRSTSTAKAPTVAASTTKKLAPKARSSVISSTKTKTTRRIAPAAPKSPSPVPEEEEEETRSVTPSTIIPSTPPPHFPHELEKSSASPGQSSNAENRSPQMMRILGSSPPIGESTPKDNNNQHRMLERFRESEGYSPGPERKSRPLQGLEPVSLEPLLGLDDSDLTLALPTPTPRKGGRASDFLIAEEEDEDDGISGTPLPLPPAALHPRPGGKGFLIGSQEFMIYSDPKSTSPSQETPRNNDWEDMSDTMAPPRSSPTPLDGKFSPARKRSSSEAAMDSDDELTATEITPRSKRTRAEPRAKQVRKSTRKKGARSETDTLRELLPKRKSTRATRNRRDETEDTTDASKGTPPRPTRDGKPTTSSKKPSAKSKNTKGSEITKQIWPCPPTSTNRARQTYTRRALDNSANETIVIGGGGEVWEEGNLEVLSSDPTSSLEMGDGKVSSEGRKTLREIKKKFEEVDGWALEFEDVSLVASSDGDKR